jgi:hypothetical protein
MRPVPALPRGAIKTTIDARVGEPYGYKLLISKGGKKTLLEVGLERHSRCTSDAL